MRCGSALAMGDPATELVRVAAEEQVDLIAMSTHGIAFSRTFCAAARRIASGTTCRSLMLMVRAK
jgi:nucleotide-binding universal stress UspA family protein